MSQQRILILSPHLDDAPWSLCEHILTWLEDGDHVEVLTLFCGIPEDEAGHAKHTKLHAEHRDVEARLSAVKWYQGPFLDDVYDPRPSLPDVAYIIDGLAADVDVVVVPQGIHHPDHRLLAEAWWMMSWERYRGRVWRYDELPYYVEYPEVLSTRGRPVGCRDFLEEKKRICRLYASQIGPSVERSLWAPERVYAL